MPGRDRSGPNAAGPMTGRGMGYCVGNTSVGYGRGEGRGAGLGFRGAGGYARGPGFGAGWRGLNTAGFNQYRPGLMTSQEERNQLQADEKQLQESLRDIQSRLSKLELEKQS